MRLLEYLKANPIEFRQADLEVEAGVCMECADHPNGHPFTKAMGPNGVVCNHDFAAVPDALNYLLHLASEMAGHGMAHGWEFAHYLTTWVMVAVDGKPRQPQPERIMH